MINYDYAVAFRGSVAIIGQGYVGLPLAMAAAQSGWRVTGIDVSVSRVDQLNKGLSHIEDVSSEELRKAIAESRYVASIDVAEVANCDVVVICVPTPLSENREPDLSFVESAVRMVACHLREDALLVSESTSYPGTIRGFIKPLVESLRIDKGSGISFSAAPERVDPRNSSWGMKRTPRLLSGLTEKATELSYQFYSSFCDVVVKVSSPEVAESAKLLENTFRQVNIALVNQLVPLFHSIGVDVREVVDAAGSKPYGFMKFYPGAGVGGHCIPVDPMYLLWKSQQLGIDLPLISGADLTNREMPSYVASRLISLASLERGKKVLILGVAYKPGVSDTRESPAFDVASYFASQGIEVVWSDPLVHEFASFGKWDPTILVNAAIVITAQPELEVEIVAGMGVPVLDCTGAYRKISNTFQL